MRDALLVLAQGAHDQNCNKSRERHTASSSSSKMARISPETSEFDSILSTAPQSDGRCVRQYPVDADGRSVSRLPSTGAGGRLQSKRSLSSRSSGSNVEICDPTESIDPCDPTRSMDPAGSTGSWCRMLRRCSSSGSRGRASACSGGSLAAAAGGGAAPREDEQRQAEQDEGAAQPPGATPATLEASPSPSCMLEHPHSAASFHSWLSRMSCGSQASSVESKTCKVPLDGLVGREIPSPSTSTSTAVPEVQRSGSLRSDRSSASLPGAAPLLERSSTVSSVQSALQNQSQVSSIGSCSQRALRTSRSLSIKGISQALSIQGTGAFRNRSHSFSAVPVGLGGDSHFNTEESLKSMEELLVKALKHRGSLVLHTVRMRAIEVPALLTQACQGGSRPDALMPPFDAKVDPDNVLEQLPSSPFRSSNLRLQRMSFMGTEWLGIRFAGDREACLQFCVCAAALQNSDRNVSRSVVVEALGGDAAGAKSGAAADMHGFACAPIQSSHRLQKSAADRSWLELVEDLEELADVVLNDAGLTQKKVIAELQRWAKRCQARAAKAKRRTTSPVKSRSGSLPGCQVAATPSSPRSTTAPPPLGSPTRPMQPLITSMDAPEVLSSPSPLSAAASWVRRMSIKSVFGALLDDEAVEPLELESRSCGAAGNRDQPRRPRTQSPAARRYSTGAERRHRQHSPCRTHPSASPLRGPQSPKPVTRPRRCSAPELLFSPQEGNEDDDHVPQNAAAGRRRRSSRGVSLGAATHDLPMPALPEETSLKQ